MEYVNLKILYYKYMLLKIYTKSHLQNCALTVTSVYQENLYSQDAFILWVTYFAVCN